MIGCLELFGGFTVMGDLFAGKHGVEIFPGQIRGIGEHLLIVHLLRELHRLIENELVKLDIFLAVEVRSDIVPVSYTHLTLPTKA